jgi:hypothetical protein
MALGSLGKEGRRNKMKGSRRTILDEQALIRDGNKCTKCWSLDWLEVHHIIPGLEELSNLITLCNHCHKETHGRILHTKQELVADLIRAASIHKPLSQRTFQKFSGIANINLLKRFGMTWNQLKEYYNID